MNENKQTVEDILKKPVPAMDTYFIGYNYGVDDCEQLLQPKIKEIEGLRIPIINEEATINPEQEQYEVGVNETVDKILSILKGEK